MDIVIGLFWALAATILLSGHSNRRSRTKMGALCRRCVPPPSSSLASFDAAFLMPQPSPFAPDSLVEGTGFEPSVPSAGIALAAA